MTDPDDVGLIFDQSGQLVDSQYNAESIMVVHQISDAVAGKSCPKCNASPMRRTQIVWEQHTRRVRQGTVVLNRLAQRVAPPRYPWLPHREFAIGRYVALVSAPLLAALLWFCCTFPGLDQARKEQAGTVPMSPDHVAPDEITAVRFAGWAVLAVMVIAAMAWTVLRYRSHRAAATADLVNLTQWRAVHHQHKDRWRRSWFCDACGAMAVEESI